jgi:hypothetical protein
MAKCFVCPSDGAIIEPPNSRAHHVCCPRCIEYHVTFSAEPDLAEIPDEVKPIVSRWIHDQCRNGTIPKITSREIDFLRSLKSLPFEERANRVLLEMARETKIFGVPIRLFALPEVWAVAESFKLAELQFILRYLEERKYVRFLNDGNGHSHLTGNGFREIDRLRETRGESILGFVAMWFDSQMDVIWRDGLKPAIEAAGYEPIRLDETEHNNKICDEIIAKIRRARFVVADCTGQSRGVYYEAGFATGLGVPVLFTFREGDEDGLHFDVRQFNTVRWTDAADLKSKLTTRICATIGDGPRRAG